MSIDSFHTSGHSPGPDFDKPTAVFPTASRCRVGLLGFGTVGSAVARRLASHAVRGLDLTHIFDRRAHQKHNRLPSREPDRIVWTDRIDDVLTSDVDVVVEAIGGIEPAAEWTRAALLAGKSVVTANKQLVARHGPALRTLAARQGRQLRFEAAVGGAMPIVRAVEGLAGDRVTRIVAILNGTTNAVLSRMEATGCTMEQAVADARARGLAELDPSDDLDGLDAAAKLAILCALGLGLRVDPCQIETRSAARIATADLHRVGRRGSAIRQLAHAEYDDLRSTLTAWVAPAAVPRSSIFAHITGPQNAAIITTVHAGDIGIFGAGAGGDATAVAVISDLVAIARDRAAIVPAPVLSAPRAIVGLEGAKNVMVTTSSAVFADPAENVSLCGFGGLRVDRHLEAEAV
jgi:homoserine dehydrogenase